MAWYDEQFVVEDPARHELYAESDASRAHVDFIIERLELNPGARVLDLCCGQGRHLIDLARRGYDAVGVDLSAYMLEQARKAAAQEDIELTLVECDMREIDFDAEFDAVINMFTSFGYLETDDEDEKVLHAVSRALKPGGRFLVDTASRDGLMKVYVKRDWTQNDRGDITVHDREFDPVTGRQEAREVTFHADGRVTKAGHSLRLYTYNELDKMLRAAALAITAAFGGFDGADFTADSRRMIIVSQKAP